MKPEKVNLKEHFKKHFPPGHKHEHHDCNFGITHFNEGKRTKEFVEEINTKRKGKPTGGGSPTPPAPPPPTNNPPGIILLLFNGAIVTGTNWNVNGDLNLDWSGLSDTEIQEVIALIKNDYAAFNLIITTDDMLYNAAPSTRRQKIIFTESSEWYGKAGGTSFMNTFGSSDDQPAFVFTALLGYMTRKISPAGSHETGHSIGLKHQSVWNSSCVKTDEYNPGNGIKSPIMGYPYTLPYTWWQGISSKSCTDFQDDAAIIKLNTQ